MIIIKLERNNYIDNTHTNTHADCININRNNISHV